MAELTATVELLRGHQAVGQQEEGAVLPLDRPIQAGGSGLGFNGGHLMLMAWGACYKSTLVAAAEARQIEVAVLRLTIRGELAQMPARISRVSMEIELATDAPEDDEGKRRFGSERGGGS